MELTTKILAISDKSDKKRSFQIEINGNAEWAAFWYSTNKGDKPMEEINVVKDLRTGDEATLDVFQSGKWWNINTIIPVTQVGGDVQSDNGDPGPEDFMPGAEKMAEKMIDDRTMRATGGPPDRETLIIRQTCAKCAATIIQGMYNSGGKPSAEDAVTIARVLETYVLTGE